MSQPTVSRRIDALEHVLKLTLFERDTRGFQPTLAAKRLAEHAAAIESAVATFEREAEKSNRLNARPIRLTAPQVNFSANLASALSDFRAQSPGVRFELVASYDYLDLATGEADIAIRSARQIDDERLICRKLSVVTASLYASPSYVALHGLPTSDTELTGHSFIAYESRLATLSLISDWLLERIKASQIVSHCSDPESMISAVKAGLGFGPVPTTLAQDDGTLIRCFEPPQGTAVSAWLVISPDAYRRPEVKAFAAFFAPRFAAYIKAPPPSCDEQPTRSFALARRLSLPGLPVRRPVVGPQGQRRHDIGRVRSGRNRLDVAFR